MPTSFELTRLSLSLSLSLSVCVCVCVSAPAAAPPFGVSGMTWAVTAVVIQESGVDALTAQAAASLAAAHELSQVWPLSWSVSVSLCACVALTLPRKPSQACSLSLSFSVSLSLCLCYSNFLSSLRLRFVTGLPWECSLTATPLLLRRLTRQSPTAIWG